MEEYVVEAIRKWRYNSNLERKEYLIKWLNYDESENTWEPEDNLTCPEILQAFKESLTGKDLKYFKALRPEKLHGFQRNATYLKCVGSDGPHESDEEGTPKLDKQPFYSLVTFEDSDLAEEVTLNEFFEHQPDDALKFCEQRLVYKKKKNK